MTPKSPTTGTELTPISRGVFSLWRADDGSGVAITVDPAATDPAVTRIFDLAAAGPLSPLQGTIPGVAMQRIVVADKDGTLVTVVDEDDKTADTTTLDVDIEAGLIWFDAGEIELLTSDLAFDDSTSPDAHLAALIQGISQHLVRSSDDMPLHPTLAERLAKNHFGLVQFLARRTINNVDIDD